MKRDPRFFYGYVVVGVAFFIFLVACGTFYSYGVFFKPILNEFGWSRAVTSGAYSLSFLLFGILGIFMGRLTDRVGSRIVAVICGVFMGLGYLLMSRANEVWQVYMFFGVVVAIGFSASYVPLLSTLARWFSTKRSLMTGVALSGIGTGTILMPPISGKLISIYDWRTAYIISGIIVLVFIVVGAQFLRQPRGHLAQLPAGSTEAREDSDSQSKGFHLREAVRTRQFWMLFAIFGIVGLCLQAVIVHIVPYATDTGISPVTAAAILSVIGGMSITGRIGLGTAADRTGSRRILAFCLAVMLFTFILLFAARGQWLLFLFAVIFGFAYGGMITVESPMVAEMFGLRSHGAILGVVHFGAAAGGALGPLLAGIIFDATLSYYLAFGIFAALSAGALAMTLVLRPIRGKDEAAAPVGSS